MSALDDKLNLHSGGCATYHESPCDCLTARARSELTALRARVAEAERERAALAAWSCVECEARFPQRIDARLLDGVTRCSSCAEKDYLGQALGRARADLAEARALLGEIDRTLRFIPEAHHFRNSIDARLRAFAEGGKS